MPEGLSVIQKTRGYRLSKNLNSRRRTPTAILKTDKIKADKIKADKIKADKIKADKIKTDKIKNARAGLRRHGNLRKIESWSKKVSAGLRRRGLV